MLNAPRFERVAHRGSPREMRENTLPGFLLALRHGADAVELDVHVTSDGTVVVHHDPDVQGHRIAATPWTVLSGLDLGEEQRIPTLADVLDAIGGRAGVYIEMKGEGTEEATISVARKRGMRFALHSFDHDAIERAARRAPDIARGVLLGGDIQAPIARMREAVARTRARDVWPHWSLVDARFMAAAIQLGVRVICWTVNAGDKAGHLRTLGVSAVCTDDVRLLANL